MRRQLQTVCSNTQRPTEWIMPFLSRSGMNTVGETSSSPKRQRSRVSPPTMLPSVLETMGCTTTRKFFMPCSTS